MRLGQFSCHNLILCLKRLERPKLNSGFVNARVMPRISQTTTFINFALAHSASLSITDFITIFIIKGTFSGNFTLYMCLLPVYFMRNIILTMSTNNTSAIYIFIYTLFEDFRCTIEESQMAT